MFHVILQMVPLVVALEAGGGQPIEYNRDIRPILTTNCFSCHGTDSGSRKDDLRIDRFEDATLPREGSRPAIVAGKPDESEMIARIESKDEPMPPVKSHKVLTAAEKGLLRRWVAQGAVYQRHWSFVPPTRPALPNVKQTDWAKNAIDHFILASLERANLTPAPPADRRTLIRRLSLDLTGLPPTPLEVEAYVNDAAPNAYESVVDRLLASARWGEHRGRYWLDYARYADTNGIHFDNYRETWVYRDWVIKAFNRNLPFDQFTIEQLAGDLLPNASMDQKIASGFNRCNITTSEGGAIDEEYLVLYARDRTETTSQVWLGLTTGCAVCHDHKYDPISQKDFYALSAFFNNTTQEAMDGNIQDTPPIMVVPSAGDRARWATTSRNVTKARQLVAGRTREGKTSFAAWLKNPPLEKLPKEVPNDNLLVHLPLSEGTEKVSARVGKSNVELAFKSSIAWQPGAIADQAFTAHAVTTPELEGAGDFERDQPFTYAAWVRMSSSRNGSILARMNEEDGYRGWDMWLEDGRPGAHIIHNWPDDALKVVAKQSLPSERWSHVCVTYDGSSQLAGVKVFVDGEAQDLEVQADSLRNTIRSKVPFKVGQRHKANHLENTGVQDVRIYGRALNSDEVRRLANVQRISRLTKLLLASPLAATPIPTSPPPGALVGPKKKTDPDPDELYNRWLVTFDRDFQRAKEDLALQETLESFYRARGTVAHVMSERPEPAKAYVLSRGQYDRRAAAVTANTPEALPSMGSNLPRDRVGLARWLVSEEQPLTARVVVNRFWQEVFGTGIVKTAGDFGVSGAEPTHPKLLDWLAVEFRTSGWNIKRLFKLMVMSAAYQQSAAATPAKIAADPQNLLLSRGPRFRMDAEMVRDYALTSSGLLVDKIGGPSVKPYQPDGVWEAVAMPGSNTRFYRHEQGENLYRRSLYTFWKRSAPPASMEIFNAPSRETCAVQRERTNTPLQALATLNDDQFMEAARVLAQQALRENASNAARIDFMARRALGRPLRANEAKIANASLGELMRHYRGKPDAAALLIRVGEKPFDTAINGQTLAAFTMLANSLLNLDEALNK